MTELELRQKVVATAKAWYGRREANGGHKEIIDTYNTIKPLPRGYKVKYTDHWCATYVSAVMLRCGLLDIAPAECSCSKMTALHKQLGTWVEDDSYRPAPGDIVMYDWQDSGKGDNTGAPDHVGIVVSVVGNAMTIIEGNKHEAVGYRSMQVNGRYIRGYCVPDYSKHASHANGKPNKTPVYRVGDIVDYTGNTHYYSANSVNGKSCRPGVAEVTQVWDGSHPYQLIAVKGGGSNVYGWVNAADIKGLHK